MNHKVLALFTCIVLVFTALATVAQAQDAAYVVKRTDRTNAEIMSVLNELGLDITLVDDADIPTTDLTAYDVVVVGPENIDNDDDLPLGSVNFVTLDSTNADEWGFSTGLGRVTSSQTLIATNLDHPITFGLSEDIAIYSGTGVGASYLSGIKAFPAEQTATIVEGEPGRVYIAALEPGVRLINGPIISKRTIYYGISETDRWTNSARLLFKNSIHYALYGGDTDGDGILDESDNCPDVANFDQSDVDNDGKGDVCDDDDGDGVLDIYDNCPTVSNPDQANNEADAFGDLCDLDDDNDNITDSVDNCQFIPNALQSDRDGDNLGDACDAYPDDFDNDGVSSSNDNCPIDFNPNQEDVDGDGIGDVCDANPQDGDNDGIIDAIDNCPTIPNADQTDTDNDNVGNVCDADDDNDGLDDTEDNCDLISNADQADYDNDGEGDACEDDYDGDGRVNTNDNCLSTFNPSQLDANSNGVGDQCEVRINEFALDPQTDRNSDSTVNDADRFIELFQSFAADIDLVNWNLAVTDVSGTTTYPLDGSIDALNYLTLIPSGSIDILAGKMVLTDTFGQEIDAVSFGLYNDGNPFDNAPNGDATSTDDECVARTPNGQDTGTDTLDFSKQGCRFGFSNDDDITPPVVSLMSPTHGALITEDEVVATFIATDNNAGSVTCSLYADFDGNFTKLATQTVLSGANGTFSASDIDDGSYTWNVECHDGNEANTAFAPTHYTFEIDEPDAPVVEDIATITVNETQTIEIIVNATDADNDPLTYTIDNGNFTNVDNTFTWTTDYFDSGVYPVVITVSDGIFNTTESTTVIVNNDNREPVFSGTIADITIDEDAYEDTLNLSEYFSDPDNEELTFGIGVRTSPEVFLRFEEGIVNISAMQNFNGEANVSFTASDGEAQVESNNVTITFTPVNDQPVLAQPADQSVVQGSTLTLQLAAMDVDEDPLVFTTLDNFGGLLSLNTSGYLEFTPDNNIAGNDYVIDLSVSDGAASDTKNTTITVVPALEVGNVVASVNPVFSVEDGDVIDAMPGQTVNLDFTISNNFDEAIFGIDIAGSLDLPSAVVDTASITQLNAGASSGVSLQFPIPTIVDATTYELEVTVAGVDDDRIDHTDTFIFYVQVNKDNDALIIDSATFDPKELACSDNTNLEVVFTNTGSFDQNDVQVDVNIANLGITEKVIVDIPANTQVTVNVPVSIPTDTTAGSYSATIDATYFFVNTVSTTATFEKQSCGINSFSPTDLSPVISDHGSQTFSVDLPNITGISTQWSFNGANVGSPGDTSYTVDGTPSLVGEHQVTANILYLGSEIEEQNWTLTITENSVPVANAGPDREQIVNVTASLDGTGSSDAENDPLTYLWTFIDGPETVTLSDETAAKPTFMATELGAYTFSLVVNDGIVDSSEDTVTLTLIEPPRLAITELEVEVDGDDEDVRNGDRIREEAEPSSRVSFDIEVSNLYSKQDNIDFEDVEVEITIYDIDDGDELDEDSGDDDIDSGDEEDFDVDFDLPFDAEEGIYDVEIVVTGEEVESGREHTVTWMLQLEVEREKHDIRIVDALLNPSTIRCGKSTNLGVRLVNVGEDDEDEVALRVSNPNLGIDIIEAGLDLDNKQDDDDSQYFNSFAINIPASTTPGRYPISVSSFHDLTRLDEQRTLDLLVESCEPEPEYRVVRETQPQTTRVIPAEVEEEDITLEVESQNRQGTGLQEAKTIKRPKAKTYHKSFIDRDNSMYEAILLSIGIIIVAMILYALAYLYSRGGSGKKPKKQSKKDAILTNF